jgi:hypothetical protein
LTIISHDKAKSGKPGLSLEGVGGVVQLPWAAVSKGAARQNTV